MMENMTHFQTATGSQRKEEVRRVLEALREPTRIVLTTHINADGDGAGSEVALAAWWRARGREAWLLNPTPFPESLRFLLPEEDWVVHPGTERARAVAEAAELAVVLDTGETPRLGRVAPLLNGLPTVVVDHHPPGPDPIPGISLRDPSACATGELVFDLLQESGGPWPQSTVLGLYVAILSDTGAFRFSNTSPAAHRIAAFLVERGVEPEEVYRQVYGAIPLRKLRLLKEALAELEVDPEVGLAWMTVPSSAYEGLGAAADDLEGLVDYPRAVEGVEVGLLFRQTARGHTKVSFRSNGRVDVNRLARRFGGGGHVKASGALVERPLEEVREEVIAATRQAILESRSDGG